MARTDLSDSDHSANAFEEELIQLRAPPKRKSAQTSGRAKKKRNRSGEASEDDEDGIPSYLSSRRRRFDQESALKTPPDYSDVYFSDDDKPHVRLQTRPCFEENSRVNPVRERKEIMLDSSAGVIPASIAQYLRDYQITGVEFLHRHFVYQTGGILGDDMGLGKTVQVAAFLTAAFGKTGDHRDEKRMRKMRRLNRWYPSVLIICPGSIMDNWKNELLRWGWWKTEIFRGSREEKNQILAAAKGGWVEALITTYETYKNHRDSLNQVEWDCVVADECHRIKDLTTATTKAMNQVNALCRIGLTGTAIQNNLNELWTLLNWTNPTRFGTRSEWNDTVTKPLTMGQSHKATNAQLHLARTTAKNLVTNLLPDYFLRRMKTLIAHQLPKKSDKVVFCPLSGIQQEAYENFLNGTHVQFIKQASDICPCGSGLKKGWCCYEKLPDGRSWNAIVLPALMTLQKLANHLTLLIPSSAEKTQKHEWERETLRTCVPDRCEELWEKRDQLLMLSNPLFCGKWKILKRLLNFWHENGDKVLVFSHSVRLLKILQMLLQNTSYTVSFLDGQVPVEERQQVVDDFNSSPGHFVFLISTKAGGVGLNITSANKVVIFDPHWNPSYDLQAQDRAYRIGQVRDVDVFRLVSAGTIEEIVYARQIYKQQQANIGYTASEERRYFDGVQNQSGHQGEIFGLRNLFSFRQVTLRDIVHKTNIAEAKAEITLMEIDMEKAVKDEDADFDFIKKEKSITIKKEENDDDGGMLQLAELIQAKDQKTFLEKSEAPKTDAAVAAILAGAGVEYTHQNAEVIGSSKVEAQLSRHAERVVSGRNGDDNLVHPDNDSALFVDSSANSVPIGPDGSLLHLRFHPPEDVMRRQFCTMAREFGFASATDFALVVEDWTQEQRRECLDAFYKRRQVRLMELALSQVKEEDEKKEKALVGDDEGAVKSEVDGERVGELGPSEETKNGMKHEVPRAGEGGAQDVQGLPPPKPDKSKDHFIFFSDDDDDDEL